MPCVKTWTDTYSNALTHLHTHRRKSTTNMHAQTHVHTYIHNRRINAFKGSKSNIEDPKLKRKKQLDCKVWDCQPSVQNKVYKMYAACFSRSAKQALRCFQVKGHIRCTNRKPISKRPDSQCA